MGLRKGGYTVIHQNTPWDLILAKSSHNRSKWLSRSIFSVESPYPFSFLCSPPQSLYQSLFFKAIISYSFTMAKWFWLLLAQFSLNTNFLNPVAVSTGLTICFFIQIFKKSVGLGWIKCPSWSNFKKNYLTIWPLSSML